MDTCSNGRCDGGCCECDANNDCTMGDRRVCDRGRCIETRIASISYDVRGHERGQTICTNSNPPGTCGSTEHPTTCVGQRTCQLKIAWAGAFGGGGDLGRDPCEFIVKNVYNLRYTCSHNGASKQAQPRDFITPDNAGCSPRLLDTVTLSCP
jgi:hypothetical protein